MTSSAYDLNDLWDRLAAMPRGERQFRGLRIEADAHLAVYAALRADDGARSGVFEAPLAQAPSRQLKFIGDGVSIRGETRRQDDL